MTTDRNHWAACSPAWLATMPEGACSWAPRRAGDGRTVSHYHPAVPAPPPADQTAIHQRIAAALAARFTADGDLSQGMRVIDPDDEDDPEPARWVRPGEAADVVMAVLPEQTDRAAEAERPLSPDYEHPECGFHWHGRDDMDIPMRDGQPVCPRCELAAVEKQLHYSEKRREELRQESRRRGKLKGEYAERIRQLEIQLDEVRSQLGAEILRAGQAEAELRRVAAEEQPAETDEMAASLRRDGFGEDEILGMLGQGSRQAVEYFVQCQQPDGTWEHASSTTTSPELAAQRLAARRKMQPDLVLQIAERTTKVNVRALPDCLACRHWSCTGNGPCGALLDAWQRCTCTGPAVGEQPETQEAQHLGRRANAEDCPGCKAERRNLPYPFLCPAETGAVAEPADKTRCDVEFEGGGRCTKQAGHRTRQNQDPHTPSKEA